MRKPALLAGYAVLALALTAQMSCEPAKKKPYVEAQYSVVYLSMEDTRTRIGKLSTSLSGDADFYGFCGSVGSGDNHTINVQVADRSTVGTTPNWELRFQGLEWTEGQTSSVTCHHLEIWDEQVGSDYILCGGGAEGTCQVTVSRNEDLKHTVQIWFTCNEFETNVSTGDIRNKMTIESGALQVQNCDGF